MTRHFLPLINGFKVRRAKAPARPYVDGLDSVIAFFTEIRECSIDMQEQIIREHPEALRGMLELDPAILDSLILDLEAARTYRNVVLRTQARLKALSVIAFVFALTGFMSGVLSLVLRLVRE